MLVVCRDRLSVSAGDACVRAQKDYKLLRDTSAHSDFSLLSPLAVLVVI